MLLSKLGDRYQLLDDLGTVGAVSTFIAEDWHLPSHPQCVVKKITPPESMPQAMKQMKVYFEREAELLNTLGKHDQIPFLLDYFEGEDAFYLVQERVEGTPLDQSEIAPGYIPWSEERVVQFLEEMLEILAFIHQQGVIHGDIKPNSILRRRRDHKLVLTDFDAIKLMQFPGQMIPVPSTPEYQAPELKRGMYSSASDIYSLGLTAMQALTGVAPQFLPTSANGEIVCPRNVRASAGLTATLNTMVRRSHEQRYQTATEALAALRQLRQAPTLPPVIVTDSPAAPAIEPAAAESAEAHTPRTMPRRQKIAKHKAQWVWALALVPVIGGIGYGSFVWAQRQNALAEQQQVLEQATTYREQAMVDECIALTDRFPGPATSEYAAAAVNLGAQCTFDKAQALADPPDILYVAAIETLQPLIDAAIAGEPIDPAIVTQARQRIDQWSEQIVAYADGRFQAFKAGQNEQDLYEAVRSLNAIPEGTAAYSQVTTRLNQWASEMLAIGREVFETTNSDEAADAAIAMLRSIPANTTAHTQAQALIQQYEQHESEMRSARTAARDALDAGRCQTARRYAEQIQQSPYPAWSVEGAALSQAVDDCETPLWIADALLTAESPTLSRGRFGWVPYGAYQFDGIQGQTATIKMSSRDFNPALRLITPSGMRIEGYENLRDGSIELNRRLPETGTYTVEAMSAYRFRPTQAGYYDLSVFIQEPEF